MSSTMSEFLFTCAVAGLGALAAQRLALRRHLQTPPASPRRRPGISILKPLCGLDDRLEDSLERFATLPYPDYELLLGVQSTDDAAWPLAQRVAARHPGRVRALLQAGAPGLNPKVNQLVTLEAQAQHELLVVSDSNTVAPDGYLDELAAIFEDERVACVTNPVSGTGHNSLGALLDNLHLAASVGPGQVAAKVLADQDLVVGKSMALRRAVLRTLGGFHAFRDFLAEDYAIGRAIGNGLGRVAVARLPVMNVAVERNLGAFWARYARWSVIHRTAVTPLTSLAQALLNPWPLSILAFAAWPTARLALASLAVLALKALLDLSAARAMGSGPWGARALLAVPLKDLLLFVAWTRALATRTVVWRGKHLRVMAGSRLVQGERSGDDETRDSPLTTFFPSRDDLAHAAPRAADTSAPGGHAHGPLHRETTEELGLRAADAAGGDHLRRPGRAAPGPILRAPVL